jgi:ribosomal protein S27AE
MSDDTFAWVEPVNDVFEDGVRCWVCPDCGFTFSADHTDAGGTGYSCPVCELAGIEETLAQRLFAEAEIARTAPNGQHPKISIRTHAAALRFAGDLVRTSDA